jgi:hypothetical protein
MPTNIASEDYTSAQSADSAARNLFSRAMTVQDMVGIFRTLFTRVGTSTVYSIFNEQQERVLAERIAARDGTESTKPAAKEWAHNLHSAYQFVGDRFDEGLSFALKALYPDTPEGNAKREKMFEYLTTHDASNLNTGEKFGQTLSGFFFSALASNAQNILLDAFGDKTPKKFTNPDGTINPDKFVRWFAQRIFRGVMLGAGEDVVASSPIYSIVNKIFLDALGKVDNDLFPEQKHKTLFKHVFEWQFKFWQYATWQTWWGEIYKDAGLNKIEKSIGGRDINEDYFEAQESAPKRSLGDRAYGILRGIIRTPIKTFIPMQLATPFHGVFGYYSTILPNVAPEDMDEPRNAIDAAMKQFGKNAEEVGSYLNAITNTEIGRKLGIDNQGTLATRAYLRYGPYFAAKGYFLSKYAGVDADQALNKCIDSSFGMVGSLLTLRFKKFKEHRQKFSEGVKDYKAVLAFKPDSRDMDDYAVQNGYIPDSDGFVIADEDSDIRIISPGFTKRRGANQRNSTTTPDATRIREPLPEDLKTARLSAQPQLAL